MRRIISLFAFVGIGVGGGYLLGSLRGQPPSPSAPVRERTEPVQVIATRDRGVSEAELRRVVQEELAARGPAPATSAQPPPPAPRPPEPAVLEAGMQRVNSAIARRQWTREDALALGRTLDVATPEQRTAILHALIPALNRGEIKPSYRGDLF